MDADTERIRKKIVVSAAGFEATREGKFGAGQVRGE